MSSSRRDFLQLSASAAASLTLGAHPLRGAAPMAGTAGSTVEDPSVRAFEARMLKARPLALDRVRVTGGPLKHAQELTAKYLLSLDPDRMMAFYRERAGLTPKGKPYGG